MNTLGLETGRTKENILSLADIDVYRKKVLVRLDINSPIDPKSKRIVNDNRIQKSLATLNYLREQEAAIAIIAHQGDTLDYQNLIPLEEHAHILSKLLHTAVQYIDDVAGPAAQDLVAKLKPGDIAILGNLRYYAEEISTFEEVVPLEPEEMLDTYLLRGLARYFDAYVNDAFATAHRKSPSMVAFQELLPSAAGVQLFNELRVLSKVLTDPQRPAVFVLGGAKISDAFSMMEQVLQNGTADQIILCGVTGLVFLIAAGNSLGSVVEGFLKKRSLDVFVEQAKTYIRDFPDKLRMPVDLAYEKDGKRETLDIDELPRETAFPDIGDKTIAQYTDCIMQAGSVFANGPAGIFEDPMWEKGTRELWQAMERTPGYVVIGGGDSVNAAARFTDTTKIDYICTAGGAMVRYLSGKKLPLITAMEKAYASYNNSENKKENK